MTTYSLKPDRRTLHGTFFRDWEPVLEIEPGERVEFTTLDARWSAEDPAPDGTAGARFEPRSPERDNGHALCGPIEIRGALPGMTLAVTIESIITGRWGWTAAGDWENGINERVGLGEEGLRMHWNLDPERGVATNLFGHTVRMRPFFGVMGMPDLADQPVPSWTPRPQGGNIDCKELVAGSTLYLPIVVEGGRFSAGDGHAAQGDGEVSGTAIECPIASARLGFDLRDDLILATPIARTPDAWLTFGFDEDLDAATLVALSAMLDLMEREHHLPRNQAMALASVAVDLRITQIVNGVRGVHAVLADDAVSGL